MSIPLAHSIHCPNLQILVLADPKPFPGFQHKGVTTTIDLLFGRILSVKSVTAHFAKY